MMTIATIYGVSDDLIEVEGNCPGCDEYSGADEHFVLIGTHERKTRVRVWYTGRGVWAIAVAPVSEDTPMLPVALEGAENGYSAMLSVPDVEMVVHEQEQA